MKRVIRPVAALLLVTIIPSFTLAPRAHAQDFSFHSRQSQAALQADAEADIADHARWIALQREKQKRAREEDEKKGMPATLNEVDAFRAQRDDILKTLIQDRQPHGERLVDELVARLAKLPEDGNPISKAVEAAYSWAQGASGLPPASHNFVLSTLLADYLEHPDHREMIEMMLLSWQREVGAALDQEYKDPYADLVSWGMMIAWVGVVAYDLRGGWRGLTTDGKNVAGSIRRGSASLLEWVQSLKSVPTNVLETTEAVETAPAAAPAPETEAQVEEEARQTGGALVRFVKGAGTAIRAELPKNFSELRTSLQRHAWQLVRALAISGVRTTWIESRVHRIPPRDGLQAIQAFAVQRLQLKTFQLDRQVQDFKKKTQGQTRLDPVLWAELTHLTEGKDGLQDLKSELANLKSSPTAKIYEANLPWPDLKRRYEEVAHKNWLELMRLPADQRFIQIAQGSKSLTGALNEVQIEVDREKTPAGYAVNDPLKYSLMAPEGKLALISLDLAKYSPLPTPKSGR
jgi:hypothetical protein